MSIEKCGRIWKSCMPETKIIFSKKKIPDMRLKYENMKYPNMRF